MSVTISILFYSVNEKMGFGLLNAEKFVSLSETHEPVSTLLRRTISSSEIRLFYITINVPPNTSVCIYMSCTT